MDVDKMPIGFSAAGSYDIAENCRYRQFIDETGLYCGQIKEQSEQNSCLSGLVLNTKTCKNNSLK